MSACAQCGAQLTYRGGRRPKYCSLRCEKRAQRARIKAREQAEALDRALAAVTLAEHALRRTKAARAALDGEPDPLDRDAYRSFEGSEWLASKRGAFGPPLDTEAAAEAIRQRFEGEQRA